MKKALIAFVFAGLTLTACGSGAEKLNEAGNEAYAESDYASAVEKYQEAAAADPELAEPLYNTASALYRQEAYDAVPAALQVAMQNADETLTQQSHYNLGNSLFKVEDYEGAVEAYKEALRFDPQDLDAKVNLELTLKQLQQEEQEQEQQEQEQEDQEQQDQENQDEQESEPQDQEGEDEQEQEQNQDQQGQENQDEQESEPQDQEGEGEQGEQEQEQQDQEQDEPQESEESEEPEQQDDPQEGQDGDEPQDEEEGEEQESDPQESNSEAGDPSEEPQEPQPGLGQLAEQLEGLSEEQARQLLVAASQGTETLQEYLQQIYVFPNDSVEQDW